MNNDTYNGCPHCGSLKYPKFDRTLEDDENMVYRCRECGEDINKSPDKFHKAEQFKFKF